MRISVTGEAFSTATQLARLPVVEEDGALVSVEAAGGIAGRDDDLLEREGRAGPAAVARA